MELRHLKLIQAVADEGSLTKAGEKLFLTQSALSHQLKEVETEFGVSFFHRVNKKMILTPVGKKLLMSARHILSEVKKAELEIKKAASGDSGILRLSTECYTCYHWLPPILKSYNHIYPNVEVRIISEATDNTLDQLLKGKLDLAIVHNKTNDKNLIYKELFHDELVAVISRGHTWNNKKYVRAKDFEGQTLLTYSKNYKDSTLYKKILAPVGVTPRKVIPLQLTEATLEMIKADLGVAVLARWLVNPSLASNDLNFVPVTKNGLHRTWYAATLNQQEIPCYIHNFISYLECCEQLKCTPKQAIV